MADFEIFAWATTRRNMLIGLHDAGYVTLWEGETQVLPANLPQDDDLLLSIKMRPVADLDLVEQLEFGTPMRAGLPAPGYHVNGRVRGQLAEQMTWQLPQTYSEAGLEPPVGKRPEDKMPIWARTHALQVHPTLEFMDLPPNAVKGAYRNPVLSEGQVYFYDIDAVKSRHNIIA